MIMKAVQGYNESVGGHSLHLYTPVTTLTRFFTHHLRCSLQRGRDPGGGMGWGQNPKIYRCDSTVKGQGYQQSHHILVQMLE